MASHTAIAAVSRSLRTLLLDRMVTGAAVTLAPPDVEVTGVNGARVNLYLMQAIENAALKNQEIPGQGHPAAYGHPPLSLDLRYLVTTHSAMENQEEADLNAQTILGDAMRVMNDFGNRIDQLAIVNPVAGTPGDPILHPDLTREFERLKVVLHPASLDDITKVWSAVSGTNFRRSVVYEVTVIQIETPAPRVQPQPVDDASHLHDSAQTARNRRCLCVAGRSRRSHRRNSGADRRGDHHRLPRPRWPTSSMSGSARSSRSAFRLPATVGCASWFRTISTRSISIIHRNDRYRRPSSCRPDRWRFSSSPCIRSRASKAGLGGEPPSAARGVTRRTSGFCNSAPRITPPAVPTSGNAATILHVDGNRLWHPGARTVEVIVGDAAIPVRPPGVGDPWAAPTPTAVEVPMSAAGDLLDISATPYPVAVQVDGARSRDSGVTFILGP